MSQITRTDRAIVRVTRSPGGMARQYRVQFQPHGSSHWQMYASYRDRESAEDSLGQLTEDGYEARLVECRTCVAAW